MRRRTFLRLAALSGLISTHPHFLNADDGKTPVFNRQIKKVLLVTKCHLDVGFSLTQQQAMRKYFDVYYPAAMKTAENLRLAGSDRYTWTTGSWLLYEYLEQASAAQRRAMEAAVAAGDIAWHALPFTWQTEMLDRSMIEGALGFSTTLDRRFGRKTIGAKMTDVPGHSRGIVAPLHEHGVRLLDVGINPASTPPEAPDLFLWKTPEGGSLAVLYHRQDYGSVIQIPGTGVAVDVEVRSDNSGPHTPAEIAGIYAKLRAQFPGAEIHAANLSEVAAAIEPVRDMLPVVTSEIGDSWIYGCASDPNKVARYREVARLRRDWIAQKRFAIGDDTDRNLLRRLLLEVEHTWGTDTKTYLDTEHYRPADLAAVHDQRGYSVMELSWQEKRDDLEQSVAALPDVLRQEATAALDRLRATAPSIYGMKRHDANEPVSTKHFEIALDPSTGAVTRLRSRKSGRDWASPEHPLALFTYQTLSAEDYAGFLKRYITVETDWAPRDFGKPGIDRFNAISREWHPRLTGCWIAETAQETRLVTELAIEDAVAIETGNVAWPEKFFLEFRMPAEEARIDIRAVTLRKIANRMPEAIWLTFAPANTRSQGWAAEKVQQTLTPSDVVPGGGRAMHAVSEAVRYSEPSGHGIEIHTLDAPVVAFGERTPLNFSFQLPALSAGVHFNLFNNAWGTNYPQWCGGDWSYRFRIFA